MKLSRQFWDDVEFAATRAAWLLAIGTGVAFVLEVLRAKERTHELEDENFALRHELNRRLFIERQPEQEQPVPS